LIELIYLTGLALCILTLWLGLRQGVFSPLSLFGTAVLIGIYIRYPVLTGAASAGHAETLARAGVSIGEYVLGDFILIQLFVLLGYYLDAAVGGPAIARFATRTYSISLKRISGPACWAIFLGSWSFLIAQLSSQFGGLGEALAAMQGRAQVAGSDVTIASAFVTAGLGALCMLAARTHVSSARRGFRTFLVLIAGATHVYLIFQMGGRQETIIHAMAIAAPLLWTGKIRSRLSLMTVFWSLLGLWIVVYLMMVGLALRISAQSGMEYGDAMASLSGDLPLQLSATFNTFDLYAGAKFYADAIGHSFGQNYADFFARFIPRSFWPDKPETLNIMLRRFFYGDRLSGVPPTVFGEFYIAFWIFGTVFGSFLFGAVLRSLSRMRHMGLNSPVASSVYLYSVMIVTFGIVKTGAEIGIFSLLYFAAGVWAVRLLSRLTWQAE
jgi:oligosaccharide repeat unit polymerase